VNSRHESRKCPNKGIRDICPGYDVYVKHQSVRLLVKMFGLVGCDPPMDTNFSKRAGCLRFYCTEVYSL